MVARGPAVNLPPARHPPPRPARLVAGAPAARRAQRPKVVGVRVIRDEHARPNASASAAIAAAASTDDGRGHSVA
jgi:hypothetical protein